MKNKRTFLLHLLFVFYLAALTWIILFKMAVSLTRSIMGYEA
ncbi:MAG: hypothetical protein ACLS54_10920 [Anaerostipes hadrus]